MVDENAGDEAGLLTVLNETMGFYRSRGDAMGTTSGSCSEL